MSFISNDRSGYRELTPVNGIIQGANKLLRYTLKNSSGTGVSGLKTDIKLTVIQPGGNKTEVFGSEMTDNGDGTYDYRFTFSEHGTHYLDFTYKESPILAQSKIIISAFKLDISPLIA